MPKICPDCSKLVDESVRFCDHCGCPLEPPAANHYALGYEQPPPLMREKSAIKEPESKPEKGSGVVCSACGSVNIPGEVFCQNCGVQLGPFASSPPPPPQPVPPAPLSKQPYPSPAPGVRQEQAPGSPTKCPYCGKYNAPGEPYCIECGLLLLEAEAAAAPEAPTASAPPSKVVPPSTATAELFPHPAAQVKASLYSPTLKIHIDLPDHPEELLIGRSDPPSRYKPDIDLSSYGDEAGWVSRKHACLHKSGAQFFLEDMNSSNGTFLNRLKLQPGQRYVLQDGDEILFGRLTLQFCIRPS